MEETRPLAWTTTLFLGCKTEVVRGLQRRPPEGIGQWFASSVSRWLRRGVGQRFKLWARRLGAVCLGGSWFMNVDCVVPQCSGFGFHQKLAPCGVAWEELLEAGQRILLGWSRDGCVIF